MSAEAFNPDVMRPPKPPLKAFDFRGIIQQPLSGLLRNMDSDLLRRIGQVEQVGDSEKHRQLTLLLVMLRFASNSYDAACFLVSDEKHHKRKDSYVVVLPAINRQIMDLWFTLVYIADDFVSRSLLYEKGAYRELRKCIDGANLRVETTPDWIQEMTVLSALMEKVIHFTPEEKQNPEKNIRSWPHPHGLSEKATKSQPFLRLLHERVYADMSVEAHLKPAGLMISAGMLLLDVITEANKERVKNRDAHVYKARQIFVPL